MDVYTKYVNKYQMAFLALLKNTYFQVFLPFLFLFIDFHHYMIV